jgi:hypothetical protein
MVISCNLFLIQLLHTHKKKKKKKKEEEEEASALFGFKILFQHKIFFENYFL